MNVGIQRMKLFNTLCRTCHDANQLAHHKTAAFCFTLTQHMLVPYVYKYWEMDVL